mgnify:CR=1 FL=1
MLNIEIRITEISEAGNDYFDADGVHYRVIQGDPSEQQVRDYLNDHSISACNIEYSEKTKIGYFVGGVWKNPQK